MTYAGRTWHPTMAQPPDFPPSAAPTSTLLLITIQLHTITTQLPQIPPRAPLLALLLSQLSPGC
jgi:hypothetical protein